MLQVSLWCRQLYTVFNGLVNLKPFLLFVKGNVSSFDVSSLLKYHFFYQCKMNFILNVFINMYRMSQIQMF